MTWRAISASLYSADMSSNYLSKPIDVKKYGVIYGAAYQILTAMSSNPL